MQWSGHLRGAIAVPVLALLIGGTTVSAEQPGVPPGGGHGPAMRQGGYHEPGLVRRDLADRIAHVGRMLNEVAPILMRIDPVAPEYPKLAEAIGLGEEILRDARTVLAEGRLSREVLRRLMDQEIRMQAVMQEVTLAAGKR
jgi:hypothetical protein